MDAGPSSGRRLLQARQVSEVTLESSRSGYLYVVNRSYRSDGSMGRPSVIFPSTRIRGGDNLVSPGMMIRLPDRGSHPWQFASSDPNYAGELLIVLLSPQPVQNFAAASEGVPIDDSILEEWTRLYGVKVRSTTHVGADLRLTVDEANARDAERNYPGRRPFPPCCLRATARPTTQFWFRCEFPSTATDRKTNILLSPPCRVH